jgi:hypothetical protein
MTDFVDAVAWCLIALFMLKALPRIDRILTLAEQGKGRPSSELHDTQETVAYHRRELPSKGKANIGPGKGR